MPRKLAMIFDDGYRSNLGAAEVLSRYGFAATLALEVERVGQLYGGLAAYPVVSARDLRRLISEFKWEIANHPNLNLSLPEADIASMAREEDQKIRDLLTGALVWSGSAFVPADPEYPEFEDTAMTAAVYRGGQRNEASDRAYRALYDRIRSINGPVEMSGDHLYSLHHERGQHISAYPCDTGGSEVILQRVLSFIRGMQGVGILYAHDTPATTEEAGGVYPFLPLDHLEQICAVAASEGISIAPLSQIGRANLLGSPAFTSPDAHRLLAAPGDSAQWDSGITLNGGPRSARLAWTAYRTNLATTALTTNEFPVRPNTRYRVRYRYRIDVDLSLNGGPGNVNHGLGVHLATYSANTVGHTAGSVDDFAVGRNTPGFSRPYLATGGEWEERTLEVYTGPTAHTATLTFGGLHCIGEAWIGHVSVEEIGSGPISGVSVYNGASPAYVYLSTPPTIGSRLWCWDFRVMDYSGLQSAPVATQPTPGTFAINNSLGNRTDAFRWVASPVLI